jgi:hypothetical protein
MFDMHTVGHIIAHRLEFHVTRCRIGLVGDVTIPTTNTTGFRNRTTSPANGMPIDTDVPRFMRGARDSEWTVVHTFASGCRLEPILVRISRHAEASGVLCVLIMSGRATVGAAEALVMEACLKVRTPHEQIIADDL